MIDHIELAVQDAEVSRRFYELALGPLGIECLITIGPDKTRKKSTRHGLGKDGYPCLWIHDNDLPGKGTHIAFAVKERSVVDAFYKAALNAHGVDHGAPGVRPHYHPNYYAAYVLDPDGINVEVVCQVPH